ncbi:MAG TPA: cyclase family protein [Burkholderiales bacterium]|jgi:kynurenine formamidase|nr:cyclase family protein [Burkholderiales bacterium]
MAENRRSFFKTAGAGAAALALGELMAGRAFADEGRHEGFLKQVLDARIIDLSHTWDENSPIASVNPPYSMSLVSTHQNTRGAFGDGGKLSFTAEVQHFSGQHGAPSIDAIGHIGRNGKLFGGVDAAQSTSDPRGIGRDAAATGAHLDINHYPVELLVNRGVLLDVARFINGDASPLANTVNINGDMLAATARKQGVKLKRGDTVLIRTGWAQFFASSPQTYAGANSAGVGVDGAKFLIRSGARVVGNDTLTFEFRPPVVNPGTPDFEVFPVHMLVIADNGINIIENFNLEEIAAAGEYEFALVVPPLKIRGGTGSAMRCFALVP